MHLVGHRLRGPEEILVGEPDPFWQTGATGSEEHSSSNFVRVDIPVALKVASTFNYAAEDLDGLLRAVRDEPGSIHIWRQEGILSLQTESNGISQIGQELFDTPPREILR